MSQTDTNTQYMISAIFSLVAIILLAFTDFGGFYYYGYYTETWYYLFLFGDFQSTILILVAIAGFAFNIYLLLDPIKTGNPLSIDKLELCFNVSKGTIAVVLIGLLLFIIESFEASDDWLDAGFYGGFIGAIVNVFIFYNLTQQNK